MTMTVEEVQLTLLRGIVASMTTEDQIKCKQAQAELRAVLLKHGDIGLIALALIGAEEAAKP